MAKSIFPFSTKKDNKNPDIIECYKAVFSSSPQPSFLLDGKRDVIYANAALFALLEYQEREFYSFTSQTLGLTDDVLNTPYHSFKTKSGKTLPCKIFINKLDGNFTGITLTPVSEDEHTLHSDLEFYKAVADHAPIAIYTNTLDGKQNFSNDIANTLFPHEEISDDKDDFYTNREKKIFEQGRAVTLPNETYITKTGEQKYISLIKVPLVISGRPPMVLTIVNDLTEIYKQQSKLKIVKDFLEATIESLPLAIYARDANGNFLLVNKKSEEFYGPTLSITSEEMLDALASTPSSNKPINTGLETLEQAQDYVKREREIIKNGKPVDIPEEEYETISNGKRIFHLIKFPLVRENLPPMVITIAEDITDKKIQADEVKKAKYTMESMLQHSPLPIYTTDTNRKIVFINKAAQEIFTQENEPEEMESYYSDREARIFANKKVYDFPEEEYTDIRGNKRILHIIKAPILDEKEKPYLMLTIAEDITERRNSERRLIAEKRFFQTVVDLLPMSLSAKNVNGEYIIWNKKSEELFNAKSADVIGKKFLREDVSKEQKEYVEAQDKLVFDSKTELKIPRELISTAAEGVRIMETVRTPVYRPDGNPDYILSISEDVTTRIRAEKQIREASEKYLLLVENAQEGIAIVDKQSIIFANQKLARILGFDKADEVTGRNIAEFVAPEYKNIFNERCERALYGTPDKDSIEITFIPGEDEKTLVEMHTSSSKYMGKKIALLFMRDVTPMKKQLDILQHERDRFSKSFEHMPQPAFIMNYFSHISSMNTACREMFNLKKEDASLIKTFYLRPFLPLDARRAITKGEETRCDVILDPQKVKLDRPGGIGITEKTMFSLHFVPLTKKKYREDSVQEEYLVFVNEPGKNDAGGAGDIFSNPDALKLNEPVFKCAPDGKIVFASEALLHLLGLDELPEELNIKKLFSDENKTALRHELGELYKTGALNQREYNLRIKEGKTLPVEMSAARTKDGGFFVWIKNITAKKQLIDIINESLEMQSAYRASCQGALLLCECEGKIPAKIISAGKDSAALLGYSQQELMELKLASLFAPKDKHSLEEAEMLLLEKMQTLETEERAVFTSKVYGKNGTSLLSETVFAKAVIGGKTYLSVVMRDVGELLRTTSLHSKEHKELEGLKNTVRGVLLSINRDGVIMEIHTKNKKHEISAHPHKYLNKNISEIFPPDVAQNIAYSIKEALSVNVSTEYSYTLNADGTDKYYQIVISPLKEEDCVFAVICEITKEHEAENKIKKLYNAYSRAGGMAQQAEDILNFGKNIFNADAGAVLRFSSKERNFFTVVHATKNDIALERGMMYPVDDFLARAAAGETVSSGDLAALTLPQASLFRSKNIISAIAAPLYIGEKVSGVLCFVSKQGLHAHTEADNDFMGLMSSLMSLTIEVRQADKLVLENNSNLQRTLSMLKTPALMTDKNYRVTYSNNAFSALVAQDGAAAEGVDLFNRYAPQSYAKDIFETAERSARDDSFTADFSLTDHEDKERAFRWRIRKLRNVSGELTAYVFVAE